MSPTSSAHAPAARPRRRGIRWGVVLLVGVFAAGGLVARHVQRGLSKLPKLRTVRVEQRDMRITVGTTGTIEPDEIVEVGSAVAGIIQSFGATQKTASEVSSATSLGTQRQVAEIGAKVTAGTVLLQLESELYEVAYQKALAAQALAEADVSQAETQLQQAARNLERAQRLRSTNSQSDFDKITTAFELAKSQRAIGLARLAQVKTEVKQAEINLARTTIRAPIDGVIIDRRANLGQRVAPTSPGLFLIAKDLDHMRIRASVSETDIGKIFVGQPVSFSVDAYRDQVMTGTVEKIQLNARMQGSFVTYDVLVAITSREEARLLPHMTADVEFEVARRENARLVPNAALTWWPKPAQIHPAVTGLASRKKRSAGDEGVVWTPTGQGLVRSLRVQVGIDDGVSTEVTSEDIQEKLKVVVGNVKQTRLARIIPSVKTFR